MRKTNVKGYGPQRITTIIASGSLCVAIALAVLLITYDVVNNSPVRTRFWVACGAILYLILVVHLARIKKVQLANWLLIILYEVFVAIILIFWGLASIMGVLTACFVLLLPGVFMAPRLILPVSLITLGSILLSYVLHITEIVIPTPYSSSSMGDTFDVIAFSSILGVFALVSWISARQSTLSLDRALSAESALRKQKNSLAVELENESTKIRQIQLQQVQQLHRFAVIGQSATATLHELSNHLSILNLDISDLKQQLHHSKAIASAESSIEYINRMVHKARTQLNAPAENEIFNVIATINRALKDAHPKLRQRDIEVIKSNLHHSPRFAVNGNAQSLLQCLSILLNNAIDACTDIPHSSITISALSKKDSVIIVVADTGPGIKPSLKTQLFQPLESTKPTGLGVGLYIARHLIESRFNGTLELLSASSGATFQITMRKSRP